MVWAETCLDPAKCPRGSFRALLLAGVAAAAARRGLIQGSADLENPPGTRV